MDGEKEKVWTPRFFTTEEAKQLTKLPAIPNKRPLYVLQYIFKEGNKEHIAVGYIGDPKLVDPILVVYEKSGSKLIIPINSLYYIRILGEIMG